MADEFMSSSHSQLGWPQQSEYDFFDNTAPVGPAEGKGYLFAGEDTIGPSRVDWNDEYDPVGNAWTAKTPLDPPKRINPGAFAIGGAGYVAGGDASGTLALSVTQRYNQSTNTWLGRASLQYPPRRYPASFAVGGSGFLHGGFDENDVLLDRTDEYTSPNTWIIRTARAPSRSAHVAHKIGDKGYVFGGFSAGPATYYRDTDELTPPSTWAAMTDMPATAGLSRLQAGEINGKGYTFGGEKSDSTLTKETFEFDPGADSWSSAPADMLWFATEGDSFSLASAIYCDDNGTNFEKFDGSVWTDTGSSGWRKRGRSRGVGI